MASTTLTPSQAIRSVSGGSNIATASNNTSNSEAPPSTGNTKNNRGRRQRRNNKEKNPQAGTAESVAVVSGNGNSNPTNTAPKKKNPRNKKKANNNNGNSKGNSPSGKRDPATVSGDESQQIGGPQKKNLKKNNRKNNRSRKRYPWRKHIPQGSVDPITLESLVSLPYPPFALCAAVPYVLVEWPPKEESQNNRDQDNANKKDVDAKERERRLLLEQWGNTAVLSNDDDAKLPAQQPEEEAAAQTNPKHLNLFDGRALSYYMISQLQFIDPLNRRDLTRDELCHLDRYLRKHGFNDLNVVEAYDTKGVSLSTAGAASTTAAGRVEILQQEARVLLNALFGGQAALPATNNRTNNRNTTSNSLMQQYSNYQAAQEQQVPPQQGRQRQDNFVEQPDETSMGAMGIYGDEEGGMMVIDDDMNPSMRGASQGLRPYRQAQPTGGFNQDPTLWSANHITGRHGGARASNLQPQNFPALSTAAALPPDLSQLNSSAPAYVPAGATASPAPTPARAPAKKKPLPPANSLKFITKAVKKTSPEEMRRQFEAREEARRKAMLSNLTFGSNPASWAAADAPQAPSSLPQPTEGQLERNRAFADAMGLAGPPATTAASNFEGWARPTNVGDNVVLYPDALILKAREKMGPLLKLERKWKAFLEDDKAASLPLNHMDRDTRAFVHEYSDFWKLHTESFDPEPKRYIHCVKLMDTSAPYPQLSDAARNWRGPTGMIAPSMHEHASQQTAGQDTRGRSPMTIDLTGAGRQPLPSNPRAAALASERPRLELKERTLPLELAPFQPPAPTQVEVESEEQKRRRRAKIEAQKLKEQEKKERKRRVLELAFASDDEEESLGEVDADSDWEEGEALYAGSDEEEDK